MMNPKRMNIIDIIIRRAPKNPRLAELEERLRSLEESSVTLPDVEEFIKNLDFIDKEEIDKAISEYDFASLIESMSLVNQEQLDNALEGFATWASLNAEVGRLEDEIAEISGQPVVRNEKELRTASLYDIVLCSEKRYFALDVEDYSTEKYPLEQFKIAGIITNLPNRYHGIKSMHGCADVLSLYYLDAENPVEGSLSPVENLWFRGTNESAAGQLPEITSVESSYGMENTCFIQAKMTQLVPSVGKYGRFYYVDENGKILNAPNARCFPATTCVNFFKPVDFPYLSGSVWYVPSSYELLGLEYGKFNAVVSALAEKTGMEFSPAGAMMTCTESSTESGKYRVRTESGSEYRLFNEPCPVRPMIRLW